MARSPNGERKINGKFFLLCGRYSGFDAKEMAKLEKTALLKDWKSVRIIKRGYSDYALYVFESTTTQPQ